MSINTVTLLLDTILILACRIHDSLLRALKYQQLSAIM
ncbi:hypothetical protein PODOV073v1_p0035 [Vibrio phage PS25B.1]|nr:hypothetical protein PODOV073v1_p0035 [Vibrio phage PS25B.1]